jgi:hypothetical protein
MQDENYLQQYIDEINRLTEELRLAQARIKELEKMQSKIDLLIDALGFYSYEFNYAMDDYYGQCGEMRKRCVLYKDLEEINDVYSYAGFKARQALAEFRKEIKNGSK